MAKVFMPDDARLEALDYASLKGVPWLFDNDQKLLREESRYLRDRASGEWSARSTFDRAVIVEAPSRRTVKQAAESLSVFVDWCARKAKDWRLIDYQDVLRFQEEMILGIGTASGRPLSPSTANLRADEATSFMEWAARHQLRNAFRVERVPSQRTFRKATSTNSSVAIHHARKGRAKGAPPALPSVLPLLPTLQEIVEWLDLVKHKLGTSKYLAAKFILETGTRRHETVAITIDMIPTSAQLDLIAGRGGEVAYLQLTTTKGSHPRRIAVALPFLRELRRWIDTKRLTMQLRYHRRAGRPSSNLLFISDSRGHEGTPISPATLYKVFRRVKPRPIKWHPHFGRHAYACFFVLHALRHEAQASGSHLRNMGVDWINSRGSFYLALLSKQMGHLDEKTTETYLTWLVTAAGVDEIYTAWHETLSGESE